MNIKHSTKIRAVTALKTVNRIVITVLTYRSINCILDKNIKGIATYGSAVVLLSTYDVFMEKDISEMKAQSKKTV